MARTDIELGDQVKDRITGYQGIAIARTEWLNLCVRWTIQSQELKDGKPVESQTFDEIDLVVVKGDFFGHTKHTGGPPTRGADPRR